MIDWHGWLGAVAYRINYARTVYIDAVLFPVGLPIRTLVRALVGMLSLCMICALIVRVCFSILVYAPFVLGMMAVAPLLRSSLLVPAVLLVALGPMALLILSIVSLLVAVCVLNIGVSCVKSVLQALFGRFWN